MRESRVGVGHHVRGGTHQSLCCECKIVNEESETLESDGA